MGTQGSQGWQRRGGVPQHPLYGSGLPISGLRQELAQPINWLSQAPRQDHLAVSGCGMGQGHIREEAALGAGALASRAGFPGGWQVVGKKWGKDGGRDVPGGWGVLKILGAS